jgi:hypothetical protein
MREAWNPIGFDESLPADEYESYAHVVVGMFERGESNRAVANHLSLLERDAMGLNPRAPEQLLIAVGLMRAAIAVLEEEAR